MSIADEIQRLEELRRSGALSDEEFQQAKQQVLDRGNQYGGFQPVSRSDFDGSTLICGFRENTWCMMMHLSQLLMFAGGVGLIVPVAMWAITKDQSERVNQHGNRMINWMLSSLIYAVVSGLLCMVLIGFPMLAAVLLMSVVLPIIASMKANNDELWSYPLTIRFLPEDDIQYPAEHETWN